MKTLVKVVAAVLAATLGLAVALVLLVFDRSAAVIDAAPLSPQAISSARNLLRQAALKDSAAGSVREIRLHGNELEQTVNYGLKSQFNGNARVTIVDGVATVLFSLPVRAAPFGAWLNGEIDVIARDDDGVMVDRMIVGRLPLPVFVANALLRQFHVKVQQRSLRYTQVVNALDSLKLQGDTLVIAYRWDPELMAKLAERGRELVFDSGQQERLSAHAARLWQLTRELGQPAKQSVAALLAPMFRFAAQRGGSAVEENRAALQLLALYVLNMDPQRLLGSIDGLGTGVRHDLRLGGRRDFAQHFLLSAALAVSTDSAWASEIGVLKEQQDTQGGGSGFSFTDIAIDLAGTRVGQVAVADEQSARKLQSLLGADGLQEGAFVPAVKDLPEFMSKQEFEQRFETVGSPAYNAVDQDIGERIDHLPVMQQLQTP